MSEKRCSEHIPSETGYGATPQCSRRATVEINGKPYCTQHDPQRVKVRRAASNAKWKAESEERMRGWKRDEFARELAALAVKEPDTFPPNAQPIVQQLIALAAAVPVRSDHE